MKTRTNQNINQALMVLLCALFIFLPFSSWLLSMTGNVWISLVRDALVALILLLAIAGRKIKFNKITIIAFSFILLGLLSYFWREASSLQWLRGFRFTFIPIIFFLAVNSFDLDEKQKRSVLLAVLLSAALLLVAAVCEVFGLKIPLTTKYSGVYGLESYQSIAFGEQSIARLQSLLAGPNAFGLYLLALVAYALGAFKLINKKLIWLIVLVFVILLLTFSRSTLIGFLLVAIISGSAYLKQKIGLLKTTIVIISVAVVISVLSVALLKSDKYKTFITHETSTTLRSEQIERIWESRIEIGFLGRGMGTAGPSSQGRLDGGPNHWSENIYLDTFEELGLFGLILLVSIYIILLVGGWRNYGSPIGKTAFLITAGFILTGLFINTYTGQIGIYLFWLANGLNLEFKNQNAK